MNLIKTFITRPVTTTMIIVSLVVLGLYSYSHLVTELIPRIDYPVVVVTTLYPGAAPREVETQVTQKIEDEVATLANIEELTSSSMESMSQVVVQFSLDVTQDQGAIDVKDKVDAITADLPDDAEDPIITKFDIAGSATIELAVSGARPMRELYEIADEQIAEQLSRVDGVAEVEIIGTQEREIQVAVQPERLRAYNLTLLDVLGTLSAANLNVPVGHITRGDHEITVRMQGEVQDAQDLALVRLNLPAGGEIPLGEVAQIHDTTEEVRELSFYNGRPVIGLAVKKRSDGNTVSVIKDVMIALDQMKTTLDSDISVDVVHESGSFVAGSVQDVLSNIGIGILLTGILLFIFLHDWRTTLIAALAMPISVVASFLLMDMSGFTLNVMSLMALGISIGTLVTNSIVLLENISRRIAEGLSPVDAAASGTSEVAIAVLASTMTNIVVFTPIAFMSGIVGRFFMQFGLTVVFATLFSLIVSFTMVPMLAARMLQPGKGIGHGDSLVPRLARAWDAFYARMETSYRNGLAYCLEHRWQPLVITVILLVASLSLFRFVGGEFMPLVDQNKVQVSLEFPAGTSLQRTQFLAETLATKLRANDEVDATLVKIGGETRGIEDADILLVLVDKSERDLDLRGFMNHIRPQLADVPDARITLYPIGEASNIEADLVLEVLGTDPEAVDLAGAKVYDIVNAVPGLVEVNTSSQPGKPQINIVPRRQQLARRGLAASRIGAMLRTAFEGENAGVFRQDGQEYDVVVKYDETNRHDPDYLHDLPVATGTGTTVPLSDLATLVHETGDPTILHTEKVRLVEVTGNIAEGSLSEKRGLIDAALADADLPDGVEIKYGGDAENQDESFAAIIEALVLAIVLIYIVMAAILESFVHPLTVMVTLPLSLIGMVVSLFLTGESLNIFSLMALVMMVGLVVNNAILLLDYTGQLRARGMDIKTAVLQACPTRLRPIIMANLAIAIGMMPQVLSGGSGSEFRAPMAVVQIGGVMISAVFTLFVVPVVYTLFDRITLAGRKPSTATESKP